MEAYASLGGNWTLYRFTNNVERKQKSHEYISALLFRASISLGINTLVPSNRDTPTTANYTIADPQCRTQSNP